MRALVLWADDQNNNLGVRALAHGTSALIRRAWPDAVVDIQSFADGPAPEPINTRSLGKAVASRKSPLEKWIGGYDVVVDTRAGDSFADIYGLKRLVLMTAMTTLAARSSSTTLVLGPMTIGPFNTVLGRRTGRYVLSKADLIMTRDNKSAQVAASLGHTSDVATTDVVFAMPVPAATTKRDVVLNVSGLLWVPNSHVDSERYRRTIVSLLDQLRAQGRTVSLLAHVIGTGKVDSDVSAIRDLLDGYEHELEVIVPKTVEEVREVVAGAELVIASRMHACLNALSVGTPAIPLAYSRKFEPLLADLGWEHTIDLRQSGDVAAEVIRLMETVDLAKGVPPLLERARTSLDTAAKALADRC